MMDYLLYLSHGYLKSQQKKLIDERQLRKIFKVLIVTFEYFTEKNLQGGWEGERETSA